MNYYHITVISMLLGTGELLIAMKTNGSLQISMLTMVFLFYFVSFTSYMIHRAEENKYMALQVKYK